MPTQVADTARRRREKELDRWARYNTTDKGKERKRRYEDAHRGRSASARASERRTRPFIVWDGEQPRDTGYSLFGCITPEGYRDIMHPGLSTKECLQLIIDTEVDFPDAIHCGYGFNLDVSWILKNLPWRALNRLKKFTRCSWEGYQIQHIPHKWFAVKYGKITAKIFDVHSFFGGKLPDALTDWKIGPWHNTETHASSTPDLIVSDALIPPAHILKSLEDRQIVEIFKKLRSEFLYKDIESIRMYMRLELKYTRELMEALREAFDTVSYIPTSWHGPGALATMAMRRHHVFDAMAKSPAPVAHAARCAFFGGRFSQYICGHIQQKVYFADRNSAYPYACTFLPNLARGSWHYTTKPSEIRESVRAGQFALYRIHYWHRSVSWGTDNEEIDRRVNLHVYPLPKRSKNGGIEFPPKVNGWYWTPEAELVIDNEDAEFVGAWIFDEDDYNDRPFSWVPEYYRRRMIYKRQGHAAEKTFKLILNAIFGQCARRTGWNEKENLPPKSHQIEWAGYITSHCRAAMYKMAVASGEENIVSIDTDGILSLAPIPVDKAGDDLGEWKTKVHSEAIVWQSGMYALRTGDVWEKAKVRGIGKGKYTPDDLIKAVKDGVTELPLKVNKFIGYGMALNGQLDKNNTWMEDDVVFVLGGNGSRYHREAACPVLCKGGLHRVQLKGYLFTMLDVDPESVPHYLPWVDNDSELTRAVNLFDDITLFDSWDDEEWRPDVVP